MESFDYGERQAEINSKKRLAEALRSQIQGTIPQGQLVPLKTGQILGQLLGNFGNAYLATSTEKEEGKLKDERKNALVKALQSNPNLSPADLINFGGDLDSVLSMQMKRQLMPKHFVNSSTGTVGIDPLTLQANPVMLDGKPIMLASADPNIAAQMKAASEAETVREVTQPDGTKVFMPTRDVNPSVAQTSGAVQGAFPSTVTGDWGSLQQMAKTGDYRAVAESLMPALVQHESGGNPNAVSKKGAYGLAQLMPETQRQPGYGITPLQNDTPQENVRLGTDYLEAMLRQSGGDINTALAMYNAGEGNVKKRGVSVAGNYPSMVYNQFQKLSKGQTQAPPLGQEIPIQQRGMVVQPSQADLATREAVAVKQATLPLDIAQKQQETAIEQQSKAALNQQQQQLNIGEKRQTELDKATQESFDKNRKIVNDADETLLLLNEAKGLVDKATQSGIGQQVDELGGYLGVQTSGKAELARLGQIAAKLREYVEKSAGSQSDFEAKQYQIAAGNLEKPMIAADKQAIIDGLIAATTERKQRAEEKLKQGIPQAPVYQNAQGGATAANVDDILNKYR